MAAAGSRSVSMAGWNRRCRDGSEKADVIALLEQWQDQTQGFLRREVLVNADPDVLDKQDLLDRMAIEFLMKVKSRKQA
jgi:hypothetical protein